MQGDYKKQNKTFSKEHGFVRDFGYRDYFKTDEGKEKIEELCLLGKKYFSFDLSKDQKSILYEKLITKKKELEEMVGEKIEFDDDGNMHVIIYEKK